jgi:hypothetical protein
LPYLEQIERDYRDRGVDVLIVDVRNNEELTRKVMEEENMTVRVLLDDQRLSYEVFDIVGTPTTLIVDSEGRAVFRHVGFADHMGEMLFTEVQALGSGLEMSVFRGQAPQIAAF